MPTYVQLVTWTERGAAAARETIQRAQRVRTEGQRMGIRFRELVWTMGRFDAVAVFEAPDDETASRFALWVGSQGAARTETVRAYTEPEMTKIVEGL
ncbi:MAG: GYD domain-containing protein [Armatimonadota bacterium]|nr:GYD domain-containing protein [Armatimonadota bacterium]MDR7449710.1 GYD domain-containing protein [Armatimonadota bacterium]MDR7458373.1 GYD domain-containing protein [Armatimonadota bacterium]MDR7478823.1 GYD domain-containing protein [Armatimonadota bacterium]MDR7488846.1 GYD domain-containing protein [Armatimonadota bacterium]